MALPHHMNADRMLRVAMTSIQRNPRLLDCTQQSLIACVMTAASLGLEVDGVTGQAYLVPYGRVCTLIPGYQGLMSLARRSGDISTITVDVVYEKDSYRIVKGLNPVLEHIPFAEDDPGAMVAVYAVCKLKDGGVQFEWMWRWQVEKIRKRSKAANDGPWVTDYDAMAKKTVIRQLCKMLPKSVELAKVIALDERAEIGIDQGLILPDEEAEVVTETKSKLDAIVDEHRQEQPEDQPAEPINESEGPSENRSALLDTVQAALEAELTADEIKAALKPFGGSPEKVSEANCVKAAQAIRAKVAGKSK